MLNVIVILVDDLLCAGHCGIRGEVSCAELLIQRAAVHEFLAVEVGRDGEQLGLLKIYGFCGWLRGWCLPSGPRLGNVSFKKWPFPLAWLAKDGVLPFVFPLELQD